MVSDFFLSETALSIWAKTNFWHSAPPEDVNKQWLPLAVHMADSGEVAELIWDNYLSPRQRKLLVEPLPRVETYEWRDVVRWKCEVATDVAAAETEPSFLTTHNPGGMW